MHSVKDTIGRRINIDINRDIDIWKCRYRSIQDNKDKDVSWD